ncbi:MAG TPA: HEAT repeat domain-containing protein [Thermodesulfovibrionales bacterium]|nr:HEAT repeat domain-containing protein [Thermodesulfovibrionales bacterium]
MEEGAGENSDLKKMVADYMEGGMLENIIDMFKQDKGMYSFVADLLSDERMRVRIGVTALLETLIHEDAENVKKTVPQIVSLLKDENPVIRGDAANILGIIGSSDVIPSLRELSTDGNENVRIIAKESIEDIQARG